MRADDSLREFLQQADNPITDVHSLRERGWERLVEQLPAPSSSGGGGGEPGAGPPLGRVLAPLVSGIVGLAIGWFAGVQLGSETRIVTGPTTESVSSHANRGASLEPEAPSSADEAPSTFDDSSRSPEITSADAARVRRRSSPTPERSRTLPRTSRTLPGTTASEEPTAEEQTAESARPESLDSLREDLLISRARVALNRDLLHAAMLAIANHARRFPQGTLSEEREHLAVLTLYRQGRTDLALRRARAFLSTYPRSIHRDSVSAVISANDGSEAPPE